MAKGVHHHQRSAAMGATPKGHFVVYVGREMQRHVIPTSQLKNPFFLKLLHQAAEEYGYSGHHSGIVLPCDESTFWRAINSGKKQLKRN